VKIDSLTALKELADSSKAVDAKVSGDDLTLIIASMGPKLVLDGLGHDYALL
jgi:hypothetical protein